MAVKLVLTSLLSASIAFPQVPKKGDNIYEYLSLVESVFVWRSGRLSDEQLNSAIRKNWVDSIGLTIAQTREPYMSQFYLMGTSRNDLYEVCFNEAGYYLIDTDGDSLLDTQSEVSWIPFWIVKRRSLVSDSDKALTDWFESIYKTLLQSDDNNAIDSLLANQIEQYRNRPSLPNRHIAYLFDSYDGIHLQLYQTARERPCSELSMRIVDHLEREYLSLFGAVPVLVHIYKVEELLCAGMIDEGRKRCMLALAIYPKSIPLQVYDCMLESNQPQKMMKLKALKMHHPNHWMVQRLD